MYETETNGFLCTKMDKSTSEVFSDKVENNLFLCMFPQSPGLLDNCLKTVVLHFLI